MELKNPAVNLASYEKFRILLNCRFGAQSQASDEDSLVSSNNFHILSVCQNTSLES